MIQRSPAEISYLSTLLASGQRPDSRKSSTFRPVTIQTSVLPAAFGSSRVSGPAGEIIVGIKAQVAPVGEYLVSVEVDGHKDDDPLPLLVNETLQRHIRACLPPKTLQITTKSAWVVYIDVYITSFDSHPLELASLAAVLALRDTRLPQTIIEDDEYTIYDDWESATLIPGIENLGALSIANCYQSLIFFDASAEEELVSDFRIAVGVNGQGSIILTQSLQSRRALRAPNISKVLENAREIACEIGHVAKVGGGEGTGLWAN
ncbi:Exosome complex component RRP42 [Neolecta irregularis DAH-3]|uniref:Ribosomal RNA-processing protein 42 n=1 Tax=Neolecta irregularis (strain DAH-3) TaxID=1198029 RepID=A0A1U7LR49_NEOID|nr:Exosome complex component RRP42 [Neolecta irregularis DAH-3]|eukprot:OLL24991.1 Exosome complex component RRP42 [Neolecta irregularis DAH-3]